MSIATIKRRLFPVSPVLYDYVQPKNRGWIRLRNALFLVAVILLGLFYGLCVAIFPVFLFMYLAIPLAIMGGLILWAMPDRGTYPAKTIRNLTFALLIATIIWPNYLAIALPGLPWITINRLISFPLVLVFVFALATSRQLRATLRHAVRANRLIFYCFLTFICIQTGTLVLTESLVAALNQYIDQQAQFHAVLLISMIIFQRPGSEFAFIKVFSACVLFLTPIAFWEWKKGQVPWADHIPSFLKVGDETVQRILEGGARAATGIYRVQSVYSTAINYAEILAFSTSLAVFWLVAARTVTVRMLALAYLGVCFALVIATDSRLGVVGFFLTLLIFTGLWGMQRLRALRGDLVGPLVTVLYPLGTGAFFALSLVYQRLNHMIYGGGPQQASNVTRGVQWAMFWPELAKWPIGHGIAQASRYAGTVNGNGIHTLDSYYIAIFLNYGVIGGLAYFGMFLIGAGSSIRRSISAVGTEATAGLMFGTMLIVWVVGKGVLNQDDTHLIPFMIVGIVMAINARKLTIDQPVAV